MCGISFRILNVNNNLLDNAYKHRGPDNYSQFKDDNVFLEFNRLKVNDLSDTGNQPLDLDNKYYLVCNGEIFNHEELKNKYGFLPSSNSDCHIILHLYDMLIKHNDNIYLIIDQLCNTLDGEFAFVLYDKIHNFVIFARDPYGVRPLFYDKFTFNFSSELKGFKDTTYVSQFPPGNFALLSEYKYLSYCFSYNHLSINTCIYDNRENILVNVKELLTNAVRKRLMSERNICSLLSGGLDSSLVAALVAQHINFPLKTFSIGLKNSPDLKFAKIVAEYIKSDHTTIELTSTEFLDSIEQVIKTIESYDTTTVRASVGNYLISKYISENSDCVVVFNGDYADEVCGGYKYLSYINDPNTFHDECHRLLRNIHYFDSLRSDRSISAFGLEARVPFADKDFVKYYLSIHPMMRMSNCHQEKQILRDAFKDANILPNEVLFRSKEAFSDGVSDSNMSWSEIIKSFVDTQVSDKEFNNLNKNDFKLKETYFYHKIFKKYYDNDKVIPYLWMPKFCNNKIIDPSARKLI
jgi:asparagine synthase (glutamine-hydrolysing)